MTVTPMLIYEFSAVVCLTLSSIMHIYWVKDKNTCEKTHKLDLAGIVIMIFGSSVSMIYYQFYCFEGLKTMYLVLNAIAASLVIFTMTCGAHFLRNSNSYSSAIYIFQALVAFVPYFHWYRLRYFILFIDN